MPSDQGFILLWRSLSEDPLWKQCPKDWFRVALGILWQANWKAQKWFDGEKEQRLPAGSLVTSIERLSESTRATRQQVRDALAYLERTRFITRYRTPLGTVLSVTNWRTYQGVEAIKNTAETPTRTRKEHGKNTARTREEHGENHLRRIEEVKKGRREEEWHARFESWHETLAARHPLKSGSVDSARMLVDYLSQSTNPDREMELIDQRHQEYCAAWELEPAFTPSLDTWVRKHGWLDPPRQPKQTRKLRSLVEELTQ